MEVALIRLNGFATAKPNKPGEKLKNEDSEVLNGWQQIAAFLGHKCASEVEPK